MVYTRALASRYVFRFHVAHMCHISPGTNANFVNVQIQTFKTAIEASRMLLRVDDVVQAIRKQREDGGQQPMPEEMMQEQ